MRRLLYVIPVLVFVGVGLFLWRGLSGDPSLIPSVLIDKPAPAFDLPPALVGGKGLAVKDLAGKIVLLNFFASWCVPCHAEHPALAELAKSGAVVLVGIDYKDKPEELRAWLERDGNPYQAIGTDAEGRVAIDFGLTGVPESYLIDQTGRIRYKEIGPFDSYIIEHRLIPMIAELAKK